MEPGRVLRTLLDAYHASGNPGVFGLVESAAAWHVVPAKSHDVAGVLQPRTSLLAARIVLEPRDDTVLERVRGILACGVPRDRAFQSHESESCST